MGALAKRLARQVKGWLARFVVLEDLMEGSISDIRAAMKKKRLVVIRRTETDDSGTFGVLTADPAFFCYTAELPWRKNEKGFSCIPDGDYQCLIVDSPKFGKVYEVKDVPGRAMILIHKGNYAGDWGAGLKADSEGCILLGRAIGEIAKQKALLSSRDAFDSFMVEMEGEPFILRIVSADGVKKEVA